MLFDCLNGNYRQLSRGQPDLLKVNHCIFTIITKRSSREPHKTVGSISPAKHLVMLVDQYLLGFGSDTTIFTKLNSWGLQTHICD